MAKHERWKCGREGQRNGHGDCEEWSVEGIGILASLDRGLGSVYGGEKNVVKFGMQPA